jgi:hypothetical protein
LNVEQEVMPTPRILKETRVDSVSVDEEEICGSVTYEIEVGARRFAVRALDDEPGGASVMSPSDANALPEARELIDFIAVALGRESIQVYCGVAGAYRRIDNRTLEFKKH